MRDSTVRTLGLIGAIVFATAIGWVLTTQPRTMAGISGGLAASVGLYRVDQASFDEGLQHFRGDRLPEARLAFARADPAARDAFTQFYVAYSFYRQGWGRVYSDDALFEQAVAALDRAESVAAGGRVVVKDDTLGLKTSDELRAELVRGLTREAADFNPLKVLRSRQ